MRSRGRGRAWRRIRAAVIARDRGICQLCQRLAVYPEVDHIVRLHDGGTDELDNLRTLCAVCHAERHARDRPPVSEAVQRWRDLVNEL